ncbi:MAG: phosphate/phosphite/phosphonate ABC transporter substrate-binding protein [Cryobacterium sp.]
MNITTKKTLALGAAALLSIVLASCAATTDGASNDAATETSGVHYAVDEDTLVYGVNPAAIDTQTQYQPLMDYLAQETGKKIEFYESTSYAALIEAAIAGKIDIASFSGFTYVTAEKNGAAITPIASVVTQLGEDPGYFSQAIVPVDSDIETLEDFAGKTVCFVDPSSTSGYLFPSYNLMQAGIDPETDITPVFVGKHDVSVQKVGEGRECDAGFAEESEVEKSEAVRIIAETIVPGAPITLSDTLPDDLTAQLRELLVDISVDDIVAAGIESADTDYFRTSFLETVAVDSTYYDTIRDLCEETGASQCEG